MSETVLTRQRKRSQYRKRAKQKCRDMGLEDACRRAPRAVRRILCFEMLKESLKQDLKRGVI